MGTYGKDEWEVGGGVVGDDGLSVGVGGVGVDEVNGGLLGALGGFALVSIGFEGVKAVEFGATRRTYEVKGLFRGGLVLIDEGETRETEATCGVKGEAGWFGGLVGVAPVPFGKRRCVGLSSGGMIAVGVGVVFGTR